MRLDSEIDLRITFCGKEGDRHKNFEKSICSNSIFKIRSATKGSVKGSQFYLLPPHVDKILEETFKYFSWNHLGIILHQKLAKDHVKELLKKKSQQGMDLLWPKMMIEERHI